MTSCVVLLVEDESIVLLDVENSLIEAGFEVVPAVNGSTAIAAFDREPERFGALISDVRLGAGATGWDVARHVRSVVPTLPVIYVSADGADDWAAQGVPNSIMITKPFVMPQIITGLATLLNEGSSSLARENGSRGP
ncbi:response regulator [Mesorhizobium carmichaelinearum]|uniref:response regulator n=1 Tax=Mesorhizobium carmichaelinearum TaxID=1208188 RepID=UPI000BA484AD|nr:response regulator [Mesorhizobium carmichaelinearum]